MRICKPLSSFGVSGNVSPAHTRPGAHVASLRFFMCTFQLAAPPTKNPFGACHVRPTEAIVGLRTMVETGTTDPSEGVAS